jgi:hypothetical protein
MTETLTAPAAQDVAVGAIFVSSWGYDQTNINYYEVVALTASGKSIRVREVAQRVTDSTSGLEYVVPVAGEYLSDEVLTRRVGSNYDGGHSIRINDYRSAWTWNGKAQYQTASGWGH